MVEWRTLKSCLSLPPVKKAFHLITFYRTINDVNDPYLRPDSQEPPRTDNVPPRLQLCSLHHPNWLQTNISESRRPQMTVAIVWALSVFLFVNLLPHVLPTNYYLIQVTTIDSFHHETSVAHAHTILLLSLKQDVRLWFPTEVA